MANQTAHRTNTVIKPGMTPAEVREALAAAKVVAMDNFERDWGTRDVRRVVDALRVTIPGSSGPADATRRARALIGGAP